MGDVCVLSRPHVVSVRWLVDCLKQARTVKEDDYICFEHTADVTTATAALAGNRFGSSIIVLLFVKSF